MISDFDESLPSHSAFLAPIGNQYSPEQEKMEVIKESDEDFTRHNNDVM
jgi:hypothetical protein